MLQNVATCASLFCTGMRHHRWHLPETSTGNINTAVHAGECLLSNSLSHNLFVSNDLLPSLSLVIRDTDANKSLLTNKLQLTSSQLFQTFFTIKDCLPCRFANVHQYWQLCVFFSSLSLLFPITRLIFKTKNKTNKQKHTHIVHQSYLIRSHSKIMLKLVNPQNIKGKPVCDKRFVS